MERVRKRGGAAMLPRPIRPRCRPAAIHARAPPTLESPVKAARRLLLPILAVAACAAAPAPAAVREHASATRATSPLRIDGVLDEPDWQRAEPITGFRALFAHEGEVPAESTIVKVIVEEHRIVFGFWCQATRPPRASVTSRDQITDGDHIALHIDTDGDGQRAYIFAVNPYGVQLDGILTDEPDFKWDAVWEGEARRLPGAWTAEIASASWYAAPRNRQ